VKKILILMITLSVAHFMSADGFGWTCKTHMFIAKQAGMKNPEYACIPDASRYDNYYLLLPFHYHNAAPSTVVDSDYIDRYAVKEAVYVPQAEPGSKPIKIMVPHEAGVLYWKIVELYRKIKTTKYPADYHYAVMSIAHFIGDLAQPLHNYPHGSEPASDGEIYKEIGKWASGMHDAFDKRFDAENNPVLKLRTIEITSEEDLRDEIIKIANAAIIIANACYNDDPLQRREMTSMEVTGQVASAISLLKAVLKDCRRSFQE
jgi:S1/P1 Nuclease